MSNLSRAMARDVIHLMDNFRFKVELRMELEDYLEQFATDTERLDKLEALLHEKKYTGRAILRRSITGRGWRLHETSMEGASNTLRAAIDMFDEDDD